MLWWRMEIPWTLYFSKLMNLSITWIWSIYIKSSLCISPFGHFGLTLNYLTHSFDSNVRRQIFSAILFIQSMVSICWKIVLAKHNQTTVMSLTTISCRRLLLREVGTIVITNPSLFSIAVRINKTYMSIGAINRRMSLLYTLLK